MFKGVQECSGGVQERSGGVWEVCGFLGFLGVWGVLVFFWVGFYGLVVGFNFVFGRTSDNFTKNAQKTLKNDVWR